MIVGLFSGCFKVLFVGDRFRKTQVSTDEAPLLQTYGPFDGWMILLLMGGLSIGFFVYQVQKATRLVMIGSPDSRFDSWGPRVREFVVGWLGQKKVLRDRVAGPCTF